MSIDLPTPGTGKGFYRVEMPYYAPPVEYTDLLSVESKLKRLEKEKKGLSGEAAKQKQEEIRNCKDELISALEAYISVSTAPGLRWLKRQQLEKLKRDNGISVPETNGNRRTERTTSNALQRLGNNLFRRRN